MDIRKWASPFLLSALVTAFAGRAHADSQSALLNDLIADPMGVMQYCPNNKDVIAACDAELGDPKRSGDKPREAKILTVKAIAQFRSNDATAGRKTAASAAERDPTNPDARFLEVYTMVSSLQKDERAKELARDFPKRTSALALYAVCLCESDPRLALKTARQAVDNASEQDRDLGFAYYSLCHTQSRMSQFEDAYRSSSRCVELAPRSTIHVNLQHAIAWHGYLACVTGRFQDAEKDCAACVNMGYDSCHTQLVGWAVNMWRGNFGVAESIVKALPQRPAGDRIDDDMVRYMLATTASRAGKYDEAMKIMGDHPKSVNECLERVATLHFKGDIAAATKATDDPLFLNAYLVTNFPLRASRAVLAAQADPSPEGIERANQLLRLDPKRGDTAITVPIAAMLIAAEAKDYAKAAELATRCLEDPRIAPRHWQALRDAKAAYTSGKSVPVGPELLQVLYQVQVLMPPS